MKGGDDFGGQLALDKHDADHYDMGTATLLTARTNSNTDCYEKEVELGPWLPMYGSSLFDTVQLQLPERCHHYAWRDAQRKQHVTAPTA